jgi:multimeric flavodoxin WrbA
MKPAPVLLIVYHSQTGNTEQLAAAVEHGAREIPGVQARRLPASIATTEDLIQCRVLVVCSPEYFGYMSGAVKDLFDRTYEESRDFTAGKPYAIVISAGNDGTGALSSIERIAAGYRLRKIQDPIVARGPILPSMLDQCRKLGKTLAAGIDLGIY